MKVKSSLRYARCQSLNFSFFFTAADGKKKLKKPTTTYDSYFNESQEIFSHEDEVQSSAHNGTEADDIDELELNMEDCIDAAKIQELLDSSQQMMSDTNLAIENIERCIAAKLEAKLNAKFEAFEDKLIKKIDTMLQETAASIISFVGSSNATANENAEKSLKRMFLANVIRAPELPLQKFHNPAANKDELSQEDLELLGGLNLAKAISTLEELQQLDGCILDEKVMEIYVSYTYLGFSASSIKYLLLFAVALRFHNGDAPNHSN